MISTDPPYYDNIGYSDLSDFFYIWMRRSLQLVYPDLFSTLSAPKGGRAGCHAISTREPGSRPMRSSLDGMGQAIQQLGQQAYPGFPVTIYYAYKQSERSNEAGTTSTGWETFLKAVIHSGFSVVGTWPIRTERNTGLRAAKANSLASSILLVCRPRLINAPVATRREFLDALKAELPEALRRMQQGNIAPVDLAQAAIGPGMAVFTRYSKVLDASGEGGVRAGGSCTHQSDLR